MIDPNVQTLTQAFLTACDCIPNYVAYRFKQDTRWESVTFKAYRKQVFQLAAYLLDLGFDEGSGIAILSHNRPEWIISDLAILCSGNVTVPIYPTLTPPQIAYILNQSESRLIIVEDQEQLAKVRKIQKDLQRDVRILVCDPIGVQLHQDIVLFSDLMKRALDPKKMEEVEQSASRVRPDSLASIVYTSGTTGAPKGVMLTHANFIANAKSLHSIYSLSTDDSLLSFLPLSHVLERTGGFYTAHLCGGVQYAFAESIEKVAQNMIEVQPTVIIAVPRLFEKMYAKILSSVQESSRLRKMLFQWAVRTGEKWQRAKQRGESPLGIQLQRNAAYHLVFKKIHRKLGGNLKFVISGGAPLEPKIGDFFSSIEIPIMEGYGLTETAPVINVNQLDKYKIGSVGPVIPSVQVKIAPDGEILVKGPNVMKGYFNNEAATREVFTADGWFKTGDIGRIDSDGFLWITDRKKEIMVTSGGKNIAPQPIENLIKTSPLINQIMLIGDLRNFVSAIVVPEEEAVNRELKKRNLAPLQLAEMANNENVYKLIEAEVARITMDLPRYEEIKQIILADRVWTPETGELTPTLKLRRKEIQARYKDRIDKLYSRNRAGSGNSN